MQRCMLHMRQQITRKITSPTTCEIMDDDEPLELTLVVYEAPAPEAGSTSTVADYTAPARFYKSSSLKIEKAGVTKIVFYLNSGKPASGLTDSVMTPSGSTVYAE